MISCVGDSARTRDKVSFQSAPIPIVLGIGVLVCCVLTSSVVAWLGVQDLLVSRSTSTWPSTRGVVISATVHSTGPFSSAARVRYRYSVGPTTYESSRLAFAPQSGSAVELVRKYSTGTEVSVYYDSERPGRAVIEPGGSVLRMGAAFYISILSLLAMLGGLGWIIPRVSWRE